MPLQGSGKTNNTLMLNRFYRGGAIAQLGERLVCNQKVVGSIPTGSTNSAPQHLPAAHESAMIRAHLPGGFD
jgi:hypothetical protein